MNRTLMAVGAHADDIELDVGGTLLKYRDRGYSVVYVMSTNNMSGTLSEMKEDGTVSQRWLGPVGTMEVRKKEAADGAKAFGTTPIHLDHPQRHYNSDLVSGGSTEVQYGSELPEGVPLGTSTILTAHENPKCVKRLVDLILEHNPECIFTHGMDQKDMEHLGTALLVTKSYWEAVEAGGYEGGLLHWRSGATYLGELNCRWDTFVDITGYLDKKIDAVALHRCQIPNPYKPDFPPHQRALAWGTACGCECTEVFVIVSRGKRPVQYTDFMLEIAQNAR